MEYYLRARQVRMAIDGSKLLVLELPFLPDYLTGNLGNGQMAENASQSIAGPEMHVNRSR